MGCPKKKCLEAIFSIIKTTYNGYFFVIKIIDKVLYLSKFWSHLANVKFVKIRHLNGHISYIKQYLKNIFCKNIYHDVVVLVPNFQLSAKSSSFFCAFFLHFYGVLFFGHPIWWHPLMRWRLAVEKQDMSRRRSEWQDTAGGK